MAACVAEAKDAVVAETRERESGRQPHAGDEFGWQNHTYPPGSPPSLRALRSLARVESDYIQYVLAIHAGNVSATARTLGIHRRSLQRKLQKVPPLR
jgi:DNA-binding NtrC family response regulator